MIMGQSGCVKIIAFAWLDGAILDQPLPAAWAFVADQIGSRAYFAARAGGTLQWIALQIQRELRETREANALGLIPRAVRGLGLLIGQPGDTPNRFMLQRMRACDALTRRVRHI